MALIQVDRSAESRWEAIFLACQIGKNAFFAAALIYLNLPHNLPYLQCNSKALNQVIMGQPKSHQKWEVCPSVPNIPNEHYLFL